MDGAADLAHQLVGLLGGGGAQVEGGEVRLAELEGAGAEPEVAGVAIAGEELGVDQRGGQAQHGGLGHLQAVGERGEAEVGAGRRVVPDVFEHREGAAQRRGLVAFRPALGGPVLGGGAGHGV